jgi:hypothetical protein
VNCGEFAVLEEDAQAAVGRAIEAAKWFFYLFEIERVHKATGLWPVKEPASDGVAAREAGLKDLTAVVRDIFGNPFQPVATGPSYSNPTVRTLAQTIYDQRAFDRMPELAVALEEAGCNNTGILEHCRSPGPHVRGCWVVDLALNKA